MYLSKLEIFGFKSFAHKVHIAFDSGITAIVGPNGCGKTNLVDAIRWVLGEQRTSMLRSDKMEDVIFNGTDKRKPLGMAEVLLTIENTKGILPTEYSEVTIGRRLYRSGESEYLLNGTTCRLRDIVDLFMDTGMGANAYSVIELKMVETILSDKTDERRKLFEEAAGVTRYKHRRKEAYRRLEHVQQDLIRVNDIVREVQKTVNSLERQAKKAEEYNQILRDLKKLEQEVLEREYALITSQHSALNEKLQIALNDKNRIDEELAQREALLDVLRDEMSEVEKALSESLKQYNTISDELHRFEEQKIVATERGKTLQENIKRFEQEKISSYNQINRLEETKVKLQHDVTKVEDEIETIEIEFKHKKTDLEAFEIKLNNRKHDLKKEQDTVIEIIKQIANSRNEQERIKARIDNINGRLERGTEENEYYKNEISRINEQIADLTNEHRLLLEKLQETEVNYNRVQKEKKTLSEQIESLRSKLFDVRSVIERTNARIDFLKSLIESHSGVSEGVKFLLKESDWAKTNGNVTTFGDSIRVEEKYRAAVEAFLGEAANYLVVSKVQHAIEAVELLKILDKGKATFICLDRINSLNKKYPGAVTDELPFLPPEALTWAESVVEASKELGQLVSTLFGGVAIAQDVKAAQKVMENSFVRECVTLDGQKITSLGVLQGGSTRSDEGGTIGRNHQLKELLEELKHLEEKRKEVEQIIQEKTLLLSAIDDEGEADKVKELQKNISSIEIKIARFQFEKSRSEETINENTSESADLEKEISVLRNELAFYQPKLGQHERERSAAEQQVGKIIEEVEQLEKDFSRRSQIINQTEVRKLDKINGRKILEREIEFAESKITELDETVTNRSEEIARSEEELKELREDIRTFDAKINELKNDLSSIEEHRISIESQHSVKRDEIKKIVDVIKGERRLRDDSLSITHELEMKVKELSMKLENMRERAQEELEITLELKNFYDNNEFDFAGARTRIHEMKDRLRKLGGINFAAFEEYENEIERLKFLSSQRDDLLEAEKTLISTIDEINKTAQRKFFETFALIRENFIKTFKSLFDEGDECDLRLIDDSENGQTPRSMDPLEARIEIIAKPRGKRPTSISLLSGGEKTLTAIALLFAIYLVKPSPFCILDEVDAPLDDANIDRFTNMLKMFGNNTQFIVVTHNKRTMEAAAALYGVTMEEKGVSKLVSVRFNESQVAAN